jgi:hypothetical protein
MMRDVRVKRGRHGAETQEKQEWKTPQYSLLKFKFFCRSLRTPTRSLPVSFIRSYDSIANRDGAAALVIARSSLSLAIGTRPVGPTRTGRPITRAVNGRPAKGKPASVRRSTH